MSARPPGAMSTLPLFPLTSGLLPGGRTALRLFEPRYLDMVSDCLKRERGFGICLIRRGAEAGEPALPYGTGTEVRIIDWDRGADGVLGITVEGFRKFRVAGLEAQDDGLVVGEIEPLPPEPAEPVPAELTHLKEILRVLLAQLDPVIRYERPQWDDARWVGGRLTELLPLPPRVRQHLIELDSPTTRLIELNQALK